MDYRYYLNKLLETQKTKFMAHFFKKQLFLMHVVICLSCSLCSIFFWSSSLTLLSLNFDLQILFAYDIKICSFFGGGGGAKKSKVAFQSSLLYFGQDCFVDKKYYFLNLDKYYIQCLFLSEWQRTSGHGDCLEFLINFP